MNGDHKHASNVGGRKSYIIVRENSVKWWVQVEGLNHHEASIIIYLKGVVN